jgi:hypothetical protein
VIEEVMKMEQQDVLNELRELKSELEWWRARAALGLWGQFRAYVGDWLGSAALAYHGDGCRWWHGDQRPVERAWLVAVPVLERTRTFELAVTV